MSIKAKILSLVLAFALLAAAITALGLKTMADYKALITEYRAGCFWPEPTNWRANGLSIWMRASTVLRPS